jgi:alpha-tubulin suppressor-like RCC1 family protein
MAVSVGGETACALLADRTLRCWGRNEQGQVGAGSGASRLPTPQVVSGLGDVAKVSVGRWTTCAIQTTGQAYCWGDDYTGGLGDGGPLSPNIQQRAPVMVSNLADAIDIDAGYNHACAVRRGGAVVCWGGGESGEVGDGTTGSPTAPVAVAGLSGAVAVDATGDVSCAQLADGTVRCWGWNNVGQLGDGSTVNALTPVTVSGLGRVSQVSVGAYGGCAVLRDDSMWCWGENGAGQLLDGTTQYQTVPIRIRERLVKVGGATTCTIGTDGVARCWGRNPGGLGDGVATTSSTPVTVALTDVIDLATTGYSSCAVVRSGQVHCWGDNSWGQLGQNDLVARAAPTAVAGLATAVAISVGGETACALLADRTLRCWGRNEQGQVGAGSTTSRLVTPQVVTGLGSVAEVSVGRWMTCAIQTNGQAYCWGEDDMGNLGNGDATTSQQRAPVTVSNLTDAIDIAASYDSVCALRATGQVMCWGGGQYGSLGNGTTVNQASPVEVECVNGAVEVSAGHSSVVCARLTDGTLRCWGRGSNGRLGHGSTVDSAIPVVVGNLSGATGISVNDHACARLQNGRVWCWGPNDAGQLGDGTTTDQSLPVSMLY